MAKFVLLTLIAVLITTALAIVMLIVAMRAPAQRNMMTPFECGFDPKNSARAPFSLRFFLLAVVFLIFDMEVALLLPLLFIVNEGSLVSMTSLLAFLIVLLAGLFHEWHEGSLNWV